MTENEGSLQKITRRFLKDQSMTDENYISEEFEEDEEYEDEVPFKDLMHDALSSKIKQFITEYFGEQLYNLEPETYLEIEKTIREDFIFASEIPDILYRYRTITDPDEFDKALAKFIPPKTSFVWQKHKNWFDRDFSNDKDDDEDTFLEDSDPIDLTEDEIRAKKIINLENEISNNTKGFAHFMKSGYDITMKEAQLFLARSASFDLSVLSPEGFDTLHNQLDLLIETLLENLEALINGKLITNKN
jgi:hypothetical protein